MAGLLMTLLREKGSGSTLSVTPLPEELTSACVFTGTLFLNSSLT